MVPTIKEKRRIRLTELLIMKEIGGFISLLFSV